MTKDTAAIVIALMETRLKDAENAALNVKLCHARINILSDVLSKLLEIELDRFTGHEELLQRLKDTVDDKIITEGLCNAAELGNTEREGFRKSIAKMRAIIDGADSGEITLPPIDPAAN